ncbi:MAG: molybdopterin-dependent oxidoreductase [Halieaceae bacterium]|jgi:anaerobic selenocysteine-containing dehydrogenase|nr:molybdopterin-dependent oxidoreductase [Halieaceae bacterium]
MRETKHAICSSCGQGCGVLVNFEDGELVKLRGDKENPVYRGYTCAMGRRMPLVRSGDIRLLNPKKRQGDGRFDTVSSEQAMAGIADKLQDIIAGHGPNSVALYQGIGGIKTPVNQFSGAWLRAIGSQMRFDSGSIDQPGKFIASALHGSWLGGAPIISESDTWLVVGSNPVHSRLGSLTPHGNTAWYLKQEFRRGIKLIVIDPRKTETAKKATVHLQLRPGTDPTVLAGMVRIIIEEKLYDNTFVRDFADGFTALKQSVEPFNPEFVAQVADIEANKLVEAAQTFASSNKGHACGGTGINMAPRGTLSEYLLLCLNTLCGKYKREGDRVNNPGVLIPKGPARAQVVPPGPAWGFGPKLRVRGLTNTASGMPTHALADEILLEGKGQIRALICMGGNPLMAWPDTEKTQRALKKLDLLVVIDYRMTECAKMADYVIAPRTALEEPLSTIDSEGLALYASNWGYCVPWAQYSPALTQPPAGSDLMADWEFFYRLSQQMKLQLSIGSGAAIKRAGDPPSRRVKVDMQNPMSTQEVLEFITTDARVPLSEVAKYPGGRVFEEDEPSYVLGAEDGDHRRLNIGDHHMMEELQAVACEQPQHSSDYPYRMITRRLIHLMNSQGSEIARSTDHWRNTPVFMNQEDLNALELSRGDAITLESSHNSIAAIADLDNGLKPGVVAAVHCYGDRLAEKEKPVALAHLNMLLSNEGDNDNFCGIPRMSAVAVRIVKACHRDQEAIE